MMMAFNPRRWFCALLAALCAALCGCGGDGAPAASTALIEFYGDSLTFGSIAGLSGELTRLAVPPVRRAQELLALTRAPSHWRTAATR